MRFSLATVAATAFILSASAAPAPLSQNDIDRGASDISAGGAALGSPASKHQLSDWVWKKEDSDKDTFDSSDSIDTTSNAKDNDESIDAEGSTPSDQDNINYGPISDADSGVDSGSDWGTDEEFGPVSDADAKYGSVSGEEFGLISDADSSEDFSEDSSEGWGADPGSNVFTNPGSGSSNITASPTFPEAAGESTLPKTMSITGEFDGGMVRFGRGASCTSQAEGGVNDAVFSIEDGGTLKNAIIGADQIRGVYCQGRCTIENVWWEAVCGDALTLKKDGNSTVTGGGARDVSNTVIQHNGLGTVTVTSFSASNLGKLYQSCGNPKTIGERHVIVDGVIAHGVTSTLIGINSNYGDTATIKNSCILAKNVCKEFEGNNTEAKPKEISSGPSSACIYTDADVNAC